LRIAWLSLSHDSPQGQQKGLSADLRQLWCDGGAEQNTYSVKNYMESTRYGLKGSAKISGFWSAGFRIEAESKEAASQQLNEFNDDNSNNASGPIKNALVLHLFGQQELWPRCAWV